MMKRTILIFSLLVFCLGLSAQTWSRYGIRVGRNPALVVTDSIKKVGNSIHFYDGATNLGTLWDGAGTALVAATGRTSLGATTVGAAFFMLTNPGAITFPRINADNTVSALSAANFKTALSLTSTDVGLNSLTNKLQVELEDSAAYANGYMTRYDGVTGLALKANINSPTFTGTVGGITATMVGLGNLTNKLQVELEDSVNYANGYMSRYDGVTGLAGKVNLADSLTIGAGHYVTPKQLADSLANAVALETIVTLQSDTVELFVFGGGGANAGDTTSFTTSTIYGSWRTGPSDTTIITSINAVMVAGTTPLGTDTLAIQIYWNDSINVTGPGATKLNASALGINSVTTGTVDASFANNTIPPGVRVFCKSPGVVTGRKPIYFECTVYGYIQNRSY